MRSKDYKLLVVLLCWGVLANAQSSIALAVEAAGAETAIKGVEVLNLTTGSTQYTDRQGRCVIEDLSAGAYELVLYAPGYQTAQLLVELAENEQQQVSVSLQTFQVEISTVVVTDTEERGYAIKQLRAVEGTAIYAGKKTEAVLLDQLTANLAANNARQIYGQVTGLNIYETDDAGLQLNIGGRGLDPNRSASFNTRQNGYDISADVLGYPESYYTPPAEALQEIRVVRGAASLQYGTQFGGLVDFVFHQPVRDKKVALVSRQTVGNFGLFTSFNSLSGTVGKFSYYTYYNYKRGNGFRPNSGFESHNAYIHLGYELGSRTQLEVELTYLYYLAQQAGGLTDAQFYRDAYSSNRERNWFEVDWRLYSAKLKHRFSPRTNASVNFFGLDASRRAVGFRTNRVSQQDDPTAPRDLIAGSFRNWGVESRLVHRYAIGGKRAIFLVGNKVYQADNAVLQGPGTAAADPDFSLASETFPFYPNQSDFRFPNFNTAFFGEHILYLSDRFSLTPGVRWEYIRTQSEGSYRLLNFDLVGNPIQDELLADNREFSRRFALFGLGANYKHSALLEGYANFSQNYRSVTFSDIRVVNPSFQIDPNISDEEGFTADLGLRGRGQRFSYSATAYGLLYDGRLGEVLRAETTINAEGEEEETGRVVRFRGNIGRAFIYGLEGLLDWKWLASTDGAPKEYLLSTFVNLSLTRSRYLQSEIPGVEGSQVEFIPLVNLKAGLRAHYQRWRFSAQYTYLSEQFTDASNAPQDVRDNQSGIVGAIPAYDVLDVAATYRFRWLQLEAGVNNLLNEQYFTRRATGYPGPGIIPSAPRSFYVGVEVRW